MKIYCVTIVMCVFATMVLFNSCNIAYTIYLSNMYALTFELAALGHSFINITAKLLVVILKLSTIVLNSRD